MIYTYPKNGVCRQDNYSAACIIYVQANSTEYSSVDGEIGQISLEKTDAKTASPSFNVSSHQPSESRKRPDINGPMGPIEK